ncbi:MAG: cytochrome B [Flavobacteriia bacterium]|nr:cytochrome B [Flavobacteriia bacterium]
MYNILMKSHSGLRWVALFMLLYAIFNAISSKKSGQYLKKDKMINLFTMIVLHIQLLLGFILYFISPKVNFIDGWMKITLNRFYGMEHILMMTIAVLLLTFGRKKAEKLSNPVQKHQKIALWYLVSLILILISIPWPFRTELGGSWF